MSREDLKNRLKELEIRIDTKLGDFKSMAGVIRVMIDEEHFFPDVITKEIDSLETLINRNL